MHACLVGIAGLSAVRTRLVAPSLAAPRDRFFWMSQINKASAVMVVERGIVPKPLGAKIFDAIDRVDAAGDVPGAVRSGDDLVVEKDLMAALVDPTSAGCIPAAAGRTSDRPRSGLSRATISLTLSRS